MRKYDQDVIPKEYYDQLCNMGKDNLCQGKYVEDMGYVFPEVQITAHKISRNQTFYNIEFTHAVLVANPNKPDTIPFFVMEAKYKTVYDHHVRAIGTRGKPTFLTYDSNKLNAQARRNAAISAYPVIPGNLLHRDEYPYATTMEGGLGASVEYVDASQNRRHGKEIGSLAKTFKMNTGDVFQIVLVPKGKEWQPLKQPVYLPDIQRKEITFPHPNPVPAKTILTWGSAAAAFAVMGKVLDIISSRACFIIMPLDPAFYQNEYPERMEL